MHHDVLHPGYMGYVYHQRFQQHPALHAKHQFYVIYILKYSVVKKCCNTIEIKDLQQTIVNICVYSFESTTALDYSQEAV